MTINRTADRMIIEYNQLTELNPDDPPAYIFLDETGTQVQVIWDNNAGTELYVVKKDELANKIKELLDGQKVIYKTHYIPMSQLYIITINRFRPSLPPENMDLRSRFTDKYIAYAFYDSGFIVKESELVDRVEHCLTDIEWSLRDIRWAGTDETGMGNLYYLNAYWYGTFVSYEDLEKDENSQYFLNEFAYIYHRDNGFFFTDEKNACLDRGTTKFYLVKDDDVVAFLRDPSHALIHMTPIKDHDYCLVLLRG